jgi:homoserine O-acetyltransferase
MEKHIYQPTEDIVLENGEKIIRPQIAFHTYGNFIPGKSKVVWVCHALTANSDVFDWWPGLFGKKCLFNERDYFIVCANNLGSCYGTAGPLSLMPGKDENYFQSFPSITIRDMVKAHRLLCKHLGIEEIEIMIGGSQGGQQVMEWAIEEPLKIKKIILIATNAFHSPWGVAFNESQRMSIFADQSYHQNIPEGGLEGMKAARAMALISYRNYHTYKAKQSEENENLITDFKAASYQRHQGLKLANRFNAYSYVVLSRAMDSHHVGRNRGGVQKALQTIKAKTLVISVSSDLLFPPEEQKFLAENISDAKWESIDSLYGHDGFLLETEQLTQIIQKFI